MARMTKSQKHELSLFLNEQGRIQYNEICQQCSRECKQSIRAFLFACGRYKKAKERKDKNEQGTIRNPSVP